MAAVVLDADVLMAAADAADTQHARAVAVLRALPAHGERLVTAVTLLELLVAPARQNRADEIERRLVASLALRIVAVDAQLARDAAARRARRPALSPADALVCALAARDGDAVLSFDDAVRREAAASGLSLAEARPDG
jgi:predicted nucleic acid-binding protein